MSHISLKCSECAVFHHADMTTLHCVQCGSVLDVTYSSPEHQSDTSDLPTPLRHPGDAIALGEGNTPSVNLGTIGKRLGVDRLYAKLEMMNPTGSFKDRGTAVMMSCRQRIRRLRGCRGFFGKCGGIGSRLCGARRDSGAYLCTLKRTCCQGQPN